MATQLTVRWGTSIRARHYLITRYWGNYYISERGHCTLCGNSGFIDTRGVRTAAGVMSGRVNFCICPNGQEFRAQTGNAPPEPIAVLNGLVAPSVPPSEDASS